VALVLLDRAQETATANTTVSFTMLGASTGFQSLAGVGNLNITYYGATDGTNWESGIGTYSTTGPTLTRTTILASSNAGAAVTFSGTVTVFVDYPSSKSVFRDASGVAPINSIAPGFTTFTASGTPLQLTAVSSAYQLVTGSLQQTIRLPDATTVPIGTTYFIDSDSTTPTIVTTSTSVVLGTIAAGNIMWAYSASNASAVGNWGVYFLSPANSAWADSTAYGAAITTAAGWNLP
jgi:hypothetical protein